jgi:hypothetical protein
MNNLGLSKKEVEEIIDEELEKNADLLIGVDDPEVLEMIQVLKSAFAKAIEKNNQKIEEKVGKPLEKLINPRW